MNEIIENPVVWVAISFVIFMAGFIKLALPAILKMLDSRSLVISQELQEATRLREEAEALLHDYQQRQLQVLSEAEILLAHAEEEAIALISDAEKELKATIERRTRQANEKIERAEADAIAQVQANIVDIAVSAARAVMIDHIKEHGEEASITQALSGIDRVIH